eukprot:1052292-Amorphochlora_amoeboformis.AAC.1
MHANVHEVEVRSRPEYMKVQAWIWACIVLKASLRARAGNSDAQFMASAEGARAFIDQVAQKNIHWEKMQSVYNQLPYTK